VDVAQSLPLPIPALVNRRCHGRVHAMISPYSRSPGQTKPVRPPTNLVSPTNLIPPKDKRTGPVNCADPDEPERKRARAAPSDRIHPVGSGLGLRCLLGARAPSTPNPVQPDRRRGSGQRARCWTEQQHTPDRRDVNHEPWPPCYSRYDIGYIKSQLGRVFAARRSPMAREAQPRLALAWLRFRCHLSLLSDGGRIFVGRPRKYAAVALLPGAVSGYGSPHLA
jgi:hypothetical protein